MVTNERPMRLVSVEPARAFDGGPIIQRGINKRTWIKTKPTDCCPWAWLCGSSFSNEAARSNVVIHHELVRVRAKAQGVYFVFQFVFDPRIDHIGCKDAAFEEEVVVVLQCAQRFFK